MVQMPSSVMEARAWNPEEEPFTMLGVRKSFTGGQFSQLSKEGKEEPLSPPPGSGNTIESKWQEARYERIACLITFGIWVRLGYMM